MTERTALPARAVETAAPSSRRREPSKAALVGLAVVGGALVAIQGRVNGTLAAYLDDAFLTAVVSFGGSFVVVALAMLFSRKARLAYGRALRAADPRRASGLATRGVGGAVGGAHPGRIRWFHLLAGLGGAFFTLSQGLTIGTIGVAVFMVALVAGQSVASLVIDKYGIAPSGPMPLTPARVIGPMLAISAAIVAVLGYLGQTEGMWLAVFPFVAGAGQTFQQTFSGHVRGAAALAPSSDGRVEQAPGIIAAAFQNFVLGLPVLVVAYGIELASRGPIHEVFPTNPVWYLGGPLAVGFLAIAAGVVHRIGALQLALGMITGQTIGALVIDLITGYRPAPTTFVAAALTLTAVAVPAVATARAAKRS